MGELQGDTIMEEREELMVSPSGGDPTLRPAHFLKPSVTSAEGPVPVIPSSAFRSATATRNLVDLPLKVAFKGWREPCRNWKGWVDRMHYLHQSTWKKAGVYEAIITSTYKIRTGKDIVLGFAERWCSETNSFVFDWGEATITLEDVMILGGYSVLGNSVLSPIETQELVEINNKLMKARTETCRSKSRKCGQPEWIKLFMDGGSEIEHEAFLVLWLSRHVFPYAHNMVSKHVHQIAIHLARGTRIALAPAVLSCLYRDLRLLKEAIVTSSSRRARKKVVELDLWAPMQLVQIWGWERFPPLRPQPNSLEHGDPRMARWNNVKKLALENVSLAVESAEQCFCWRPYAISEEGWLPHKFYKEREERVLVCPDMDEELESFLRFVRACELVGLDCIEQYLPYRVAMQFGMDQDLPGQVARSNETPEIAWNSYTRPITDAELYIPSRLFESDVTTRYVEWWKQSKLALKDVVKGAKGKKRIIKSSRRSSQNSKGKGVDNGAPVPPGHPPKSNRVEALNSVGKRKHSLVEKAGSRMPGDPQAPSSLPAESTMCGEAPRVESHQPFENASDSRGGILGDNGVSINNNEGEFSAQHTTEIPVLDLEARISRLEILVAQLKAQKLGLRFA